MVERKSPHGYKKGVVYRIPISCSSSFNFRHRWLRVIICPWFYPGPIANHAIFIARQTIIASQQGPAAVLTGWPSKSGDRILKSKITRNVTIESFDFVIFHRFLVLLKLTCLVTMFDSRFSKIRQNGTFLPSIMNFCPLKLNVNVARFARCCSVVKTYLITL